MTILCFSTRVSCSCGSCRRFLTRSSWVGFHWRKPARSSLRFLDNPSSANFRTKLNVSAWNLPDLFSLRHAVPAHPDGHLPDAHTNLDFAELDRKFNGGHGGCVCVWTWRHEPHLHQSHRVNYGWKPPRHHATRKNIGPLRQHHRILGHRASKACAEDLA